MIHAFGNYELDEEKGELRRNGERVHVQPKPFELLQLLIRERERVVSLDELHAALWPDTVVTPSSLTRAVSHARRAIGDTGRGLVIRSHSRRGYRFCAEVTSRAAPHATPPSTRSAEPTASAEASGAFVDEPFVGREADLERLRRAWRNAVAGRGSVACVHGPPGIGKSRLVQAFSGPLRASGRLVLVGRGRSGAGVPSLWIWAEVLRDLATHPQFTEALQPIAEHGDEFLRWLPELAPIFERARSKPARPGTFEADGLARKRARLPADQRRFLMLESASRTLRECSRQEPLLIVLEDLQWLRSSALDMLEHVVAELTTSRVLVVATVRDETDPSARLRHTLAQLAATEGSVDVHLDGFSRGEVASLLTHAIGRPAPSELSSEVFARTEGVPLYVREAIRLLAARGDLAEPERLARRGVTLPLHALELIHRSLEVLPAEVAELVSVGAVVGRDFSVPFLASVAELDRAKTLDRIDTAVRGGILAPDETPGRFRFAHALFRDAAYESLGPHARARLHHRVALRLEDKLAGDPGAVLPELAHHLHQSLALCDPERALEVAASAASQARALFADDQAAVHLEQALAAHDQLEKPDAKRRLALLIDLAGARGFAGDREGRRDAARRALELARSLGSARDFARAAIRLCEISEWSFEDPDAEQALRSALEGLGDEGGVERARVMTRLAYLGAGGKRPGAQALAREALELARALDDADSAQEALFTLHYNLAGPDSLGERAALAAELVELAPVSGDRDPALIALIDSACDELAAGRRAAADAHRKRATAISGPRPHQALVWHLLVYDTGIALMEGHFEDAERMMESALDTGRRISHPYARACFNGHRSELLRWRGELEPALRCIERGMDNEVGQYRWVRALAARLLLALGDEAGARRLFETLTGDAFRSIPRDIRWLNTMVETAHLCAELGDRERAAELIALLEAVPHLHGVFCVPVDYGGPLAGGLAALESLLGRRERALEYAHGAVTATVALGARPMEVRQRRDLAALLAVSGSTREAAAERERADKLARELGLHDRLREALPLRV